jgi:hypothetical protein
MLWMVPIGYPETSVGNYHYSLRNNPEEGSSHLLRGGNLKSRSVYLFFRGAITFGGPFVGHESNQKTGGHCLSGEFIASCLTQTE